MSVNSVWFKTLVQNWASSCGQERSQIFVRRHFDPDLVRLRLRLWITRSIQLSCLSLVKPPFLFFLLVALSIHLPSLPLFKSKSLLTEALFKRSMLFQRTHTPTKPATTRGKHKKPMISIEVLNESLSKLILSVLTTLEPFPPMPFAPTKINSTVS